MTAKNRDLRPAPPTNPLTPPPNPFPSLNLPLQRVNLLQKFRKSFLHRSLLTNSCNSFQNSSVVETGLSDFHKMIVTVMKTFFQRLLPKVRHYRNYNKNVFRASLFNELSKFSIEAIDLNEFVTV